MLEATDHTFAPVHFTDEHRAIARATERFWIREVVPHLDAIQRQAPGVAALALRKSAELGLTAVFTGRAITRTDEAARTVLAANSEGDARPNQFSSASSFDPARGAEYA